MTNILLAPTSSLSHCLAATGLATQIYVEETTSVICSTELAAEGGTDLILALYVRRAERKYKM